MQNVFQDAKLSLESRTMSNLTEKQVNDPISANFIRFMSAKTQSDSARVHAHDHTGFVLEVVLNLKFSNLQDL